MGDLVLWGDGGHGKVVLDIAREMGAFEAISFIDDASEGLGHKFCGCEVFEASRYLQSLNDRVRSQYLVSIGTNERRAACFQMALEYGLLPVTLVHPCAVRSQSSR